MEAMLICYIPNELSFPFFILVSNISISHLYYPGQHSLDILKELSTVSYIISYKPFCLTILYLYYLSIASYDLPIYGMNGME